MDAKLILGPHERSFYIVGKNLQGLVLKTGQQLGLVTLGPKKLRSLSPLSKPLRLEVMK